MNRSYQNCKYKRPPKATTTSTHHPSNYQKNPAQASHSFIGPDSGGFLNSGLVGLATVAIGGGIRGMSFPRVSWQYRFSGIGTRKVAEAWCLVLACISHDISSRNAAMAGADKADAEIRDAAAWTPRSSGFQGQRSLHQPEQAAPLTRLAGRPADS